MNQKIKEKVKSLPSSSGVYIMKNKNEEVIYIGKAKVLKNRVSQYFQNSKKHIKVQTMVDNIFDFDYILTPTELDAFILENTLIKKHKPFFNILLKDGKQYPYIRVNIHDKYPKFKVVRKVKNDGAKYFGPYFGKINAYGLLKTLNNAFAIRTCDKEFKKTTNNRPCLNYSIGLCSAPCCNKISKDNYKLLVKKAINFLNGNEKELLKILENKMKIASDNENFETALMLRDRIKMINELSNKSIVDLAKNSQLDIFVIEAINENTVVNATIIRYGKLLSSQNYNIQSSNDNLEEAISSFILQYYSNKLIPKEILININVDSNLISNALSLIKGSTVKINFPQKGIKKNLLKMAEKNALNYLEKECNNTNEDLYLQMLNNLKISLNLKTLPNRMECYDISHISGENKVGSMVVFGYGRPLKSNYRKFKIKTVIGNDDFSSLKEVIKRRIKEFDLKKDDSFSKKPDLIIIDGGKGQLSSVVEVLQNSSFNNIPVISLAKKLEEVFIPNKSTSIIFERGSLQLKLLQNIRDEAHRFAITFHRSLRTKNLIK